MAGAECGNCPNDPCAAGNFLNVSASDLVPEVNKALSFKTSVVHFLVFAARLGLLFALAIGGGP